MGSTSFIHKNRNYILAFLVITFILILIIFYNTRGGMIVPETGEIDIGSNVGVSIATPPPDAIEPAETYHEQIVNQRHDFGLFETELKSMGFYEKGGVTYFRVDIWVHNVGDNAEDFMWDKAKIQQVPALYLVSSTDAEWSEIPSGGEVEGYILFEDVPSDLSGQIVVVIGHSVGYSSILGFTTQSPHKYVLDLL